MWVLSIGTTNHSQYPIHIIQIQFFKYKIINQIYPQLELNKKNLQHELTRMQVLFAKTIRVKCLLYDAFIIFHKNKGMANANTKSSRKKIISLTLQLQK